MDQTYRDWHKLSSFILSRGKRACCKKVQHQAKGNDMKKQMLDIAIVLTILLATGGSAYAGVTVPACPTIA